LFAEHLKIIASRNRDFSSDCPPSSTYKSYLFLPKRNRLRINCRTHALENGFVIIRSMYPISNQQAQPDKLSLSPSFSLKNQYQSRAMRARLDAALSKPRITFLIFLTPTVSKIYTRYPRGFLRNGSSRDINYSTQGLNGQLSRTLRPYLAPCSRRM